MWAGFLNIFWRGGQVKKIHFEIEGGIKVGHYGYMIHLSLN